MISYAIGRYLKWFKNPENGEMVLFGKSPNYMAGPWEQEKEQTRVGATEHWEKQEIFVDFI